LREVSKAIEEDKNYIFPLQPSLMYVPSHPIGWEKKGHFGDNFYVADNPEYGAVFTYYLDESFESLKDKRIKEEAEKMKANEDITYPSNDEFKKEDTQLEAYLLFTIKDKNGDVVKKLKSPISKGLQRIAWDFKYEGINPTSLKVKKHNIASQGEGRPAMPGTYTIEMAKVINEKITPIGNKQSFEVRSLYNNRLQSRPELSQYYDKMEAIAKTFGTITNRCKTQEKQINLIIASFKVNTKDPEKWIAQALEVKSSLDSINILLYGDKDILERNDAAAPGLQSRLYSSIYEIWGNPEGLTGTHKKDVEIVGSHNASLMANLEANQKIIDKLNQELDRIGAPFTPGR